MTTSTVKPVRWAGPFTSGEIPLAFNFKFDPVDTNFTGFDLEATLEDDDLSEMVFAGTVVWADILTGVVTIQLGDTDVELPADRLMVTRRLMVWAGNGSTNRIASVEIKFNCHPAIGTPPSI